MLQDIRRKADTKTPIMVFKLGNKEVEIDGEKRMIASAPAEKDGLTYIPASAFPEIYGGWFTEVAMYHAWMMNCMGVDIMMLPGYQSATVGESPTPIQGTPYMEEDVLMVPLQDFVPFLGLVFETDGQNTAVFQYKYMRAEKCSAEGINVVPGQTVTVNFRHPVDASTVSHIKVSEGGGFSRPEGSMEKLVSGEWKVDGETATFCPEVPFQPDRLYEINIGEEVRAVDGTKVGANARVFTFMTDAEPHYEVQTIEVDSIGKADGTELALKMMIPDKPGKLPVMINVHGGGWQGDTPEKAAVGITCDYEELMTERLGIAVILLSYRCLGAHGTFEKALADVQMGIEYVKNVAEKYNLDMERIGFYGGSAGTPLAAVTAGRVPGTKVFVGVSGIYDFGENPDSIFPYAQDIDKEYEVDTEKHSAIKLISEDTPATLLMHGKNDKIINYRQSVRYAEAIRSSGGIAQAQIFEGAQHGFGDAQSASTYYLEQFLRQNLL